MELKELFKIIPKNKKTLYLYGAIGLFFGVLVYMIPPKFISTGSFYIKRMTETNPSFFTYDGYYSQQTALSYTNTVVGLLESVDLQSKALNQLKIPVNEQSLRKYARFIDVKKSSPQIVKLTVKGNTVSESRNLWEAVANELLITNQQLNANGDSKLEVSKISAQPVVKGAFRSLGLNIPAGILLGLGAGVTLIAFKEYD